ncbi:hypothetical protein SMAC4_13128 [Sordaria macrospora]|uniref:uncharacterized protein n=1 Tax=Sordaria macrospora TaxID=5147 RepID=UPI002B2D773F|nr:hypothetical protein SMAC4_13128 [Sordaria macrospora]
MRPPGHTDHGRLGRVTSEGGGGGGGGFGGGGLESTTAAGRRGAVRLPPSMIRQDATVGQSL